MRYIVVAMSLLYDIRLFLEHKKPIFPRAWREFKYSAGEHTGVELTTVVASAIAGFAVTVEHTNKTRLYT